MSRIQLDEDINEFIYDERLERLRHIFANVPETSAIKMHRQTFPHCDCESGHMRVVLVTDRGMCSLCSHQTVQLEVA